MRQTWTVSRGWFAWFLIAAAAGPWPARAQAVLHPGTVQATVGLTGFTHQSGNLSISGPGSSGTAQFTGTTASVTVEGDRTYHSYSVSTSYGLNGSHSVWLSGSMSLWVPIAATTPIDLTRQGGAIAVKVVASGGSVSGLSISTTGALPNGSFGASSTASGDSTTVPAPAGTTAHVGGTATVNVTNPATGGVLCSVRLPLPSATVAVVAGPAAPASFTVAASPALCQTSLAGTVGVDNIPSGGATPLSAFVSSGYPSFVGAWLTGNDQPYTLTGLQAGRCYPTPSMQFGAPSNETLYLPTGDPPYVDLVLGSTSTRDYLYQGARALGRLRVSGPAASLVSTRSVRLDGDQDPALPGGGPTAGGYAYANTDPSDGSFDVVLTEGPWRLGNANLQFAVTDLGAVSATSLTMTPGLPSFTAVGSITLNDLDIPVSRASIAFSVVGPGGAPPAVISSPLLIASASDPASGRWTSLVSSTSASGLGAVYLHAVGPPGDYRFDGYATINGSRSQFASNARLTIGMGAYTPVGSNVVVVPKLPDGTDSPLSLQLETVTAPGETSVSLSDVGPPAPTGYVLVSLASTSAPDVKLAYAYPSTSAAHSGRVTACLSYAGLSVPPVDQPKLRLYQWTCTTGTCSPLDWQRGFGAVDTVNKKVCADLFTTTPFAISAETDSILGPLVLALPLEQPASVACVGTEDAPAVLEAGEAACAVTVNGANGLAGSCSNGEGRLASCTFDGQPEQALGLGPHPVSVEAIAEDGSTRTCTSHVTVVDRRPPQISLRATPEQLWPPNHRMVPIDLGRQVSDRCDAAPEVHCTATSSEPEGAEGDIAWSHGELSLRAERSGRGPGRIYQITCTARDASGNESSTTTQVLVPRDQRPHGRQP